MKSQAVQDAARLPIEAYRRRAPRLWDAMRIGLQLAISALVVIVACGEPPDSKDRNQVAATSSEKKTTKPLVSRTFEQRQKDEYEIQLKALRDGYLKSIEDLKAKVQKPGTEVTEDLASTFGELEEKTQTVNTILEKLDAASLESWQELKPEIHAALNHLEWSYYKAVAQVSTLEEQHQANRGTAPTEPKDVVSVKGGEH